MGTSIRSFLYRQFVKSINSIHYIFTRKILYINAWVDIRFGKVQPNNWGDDINVYLLELITGNKIGVLNCTLFPKFFKMRNYICIGSILGWYEDIKSEIWGAGFISNASTLNNIPFKIHSVRGKLTRQKLLSLGIDCPEVYGDPALLISRYYKPNVKRRYKIGIVPHFVDFDNVIVEDFLKRNPDCIRIQLKGYKDWRDVIDQVCSCDLILSSSLHGLIISDSYGIPNAWIKLSDRVFGDGFKFQDYFSSVCRDNESPYLISEYKDIESIKNSSMTIKYIAKIDFDSIIKCCPFKN